MSNDSERDWKSVAERLEVEGELHQQYGIALGKYGFDACSNWEGKERCEKTIWDALVDARLKLRSAERALAALDHCQDCMMCDACETDLRAALAEIRRIK